MVVGILIGPRNPLYDFLKPLARCADLGMVSHAVVFRLDRLAFQT